MIDITFSSCAGGLLNCIINELNDTKDVFVLPYYLDYGDINIDIIEQSRCDVFGALNDLADEEYKRSLNEEELQDLTEQEEYYINNHSSKAVKKKIEQITKYLIDGESVRIWYSFIPYSLCGLFWFCNYFKEYLKKVYVVKCPNYYYNGNKLDSCTGWAMLSPPDFIQHDENKKLLTIDELEYYSDEWERLKTENSTLRTVINNTVISVPEDFYDGLILSQFTDKKAMPKKLLLGKLCGLGIGILVDIFSIRIEKLIENGILKVVEGDDDNDPLNWDKTVCINCILEN